MQVSLILIKKTFYTSEYLSVSMASLSALPIQMAGLQIFTFYYIPFVYYFAVKSISIYSFKI